MDDKAIATGLEQLDGWTRDGDTLRKRFAFTDFSEAFGWMARVALAAEKADHHPDWTNVYNRVDVALSSHDVGGITERDFDLAAAMDRLYASARSR